MIIRIASRIGIGWVLSMLWATAVVEASSYTYTAIGPLPGDDSSEPSGINSSGQVVGTSERPPGTETVYLYQNGALTNTGILGGGAHINDYGQIVAYSYETSAGVVLYQNGQITDLHANVPIPTGFNNAGQVVSQDGSTVYLNGGGATNPALLPGAIPANTTSINAFGQISGTIDLVPSNEAQAFVTVNGAVVNIDKLLGANGGGTIAQGVNNSGLVIVDPIYGINPQPGVPVLYNSNTGQVSTLGTLPGLQNLYGWVINNLGEVAGTAYDPADKMTHIFLYDQGALTDLTALVPSLSHFSSVILTGMNDSGQIVGWGLGTGGEQGFLLSPTGLVNSPPPSGGPPPPPPIPTSPSPVPEPGTIAVLGLGFLGLAVGRLAYRNPR